MRTGRCGNTCRQKCRAKGSGNEAKIKTLCIKIQQMWNLKCKIIPVIIGANGIVTKVLRKKLEATPGKQSIDSLQNIAVSGTSQHCSGNHSWFKRSNRKKRLVTRDKNNNIIMKQKRRHAYWEIWRY
jgi:hypothetical protein